MPCGSDGIIFTKNGGGRNEGNNRVVISYQILKPISRETLSFWFRIVMGLALKDSNLNHIPQGQLHEQICSPRSFTRHLHGFSWVETS